MGCFIYAIFGGCRDAALGPTSILSILTAPFALLGIDVYNDLLFFSDSICSNLFFRFSFSFLFSKNQAVQPMLFY